jgi:hypothetical protein
MPIQSPKELPVMMAGDCPTAEICYWRSALKRAMAQTALRREQLENSCARPNPGWMPLKPKKHRGYRDIVVLFVRLITYVTGRPPWSRRNGGVLVGYSETVALRREQCDMMPES